MTAPDFPPEDASAAQVALWKAQQRKARRRGGVNAAQCTCTSCGGKGHRRGVAACPNYDSPVRWQAHGKVWVQP